MWEKKSHKLTSLVLVTLSPLFILLKLSAPLTVIYPMGRKAQSTSDTVCLGVSQPWCMNHAGKHNPLAACSDLSVLNTTQLTGVWKPSHVPIKRLMLTTGKPFPTHPSDPFQHRKKECSSLHSPLGLKMIELSESGKWNVVLRSHQNNIKEIDIIWLTKVLIMIMSVYMQQLYGPWARYKLCQEQPSFSFSCCQYHWNLISP